MKSVAAAAALMALAGTPALAHRLDEYLQGTLISVDKDRIQAEVTLTPGMAVFPFVLAGIDINADGVISAGEQDAYARKVLQDLSLSTDGRKLTPRLESVHFPAIEDMKDGLGGIRIEFSAEVPAGGVNRRLVLENHHHSKIAAYQVNCLVPKDPDIRIVAQNRNYSQSVYELEYVQSGAAGQTTKPDRRPDYALCTLAALLFARLAFLRQRERVNRVVPARGLDVSLTGEPARR